MDPESGAGGGDAYKAAKARARGARQRRPVSPAATAIDAADSPTSAAPAQPSLTDEVVSAAAATAAPALESTFTPDEQPVSPTAADPAGTNAEEPIMDYNAAADTATDAFREGAEKAADAGQTVATDMAARAQDAMGRANRAFEEMNAFGKGNVEALVESSRIAAKGFEALGQEAADFTRKSFEGATAAMRTLAATRSPTEFVKLQGDYVRQWFDAVVAETSKSTELVLKLANDVAQPLSNRVALAAEKVRTAA